MAQRTRVAKLAPAAAAALERELRRDRTHAAGEWRDVAHARFSVKAGGVVATCYSSGKLVVQGNDPDAWLQKHAPGAAPTTSKSDSRRTERGEATRSTRSEPLDEATIGSDEAGKGDYFGPIVVAAAFVEPEHAREFAQAGITDSKTLTDARAHELARWVRARTPVAVEMLAPVDYNREHGLARNLNVLLARMHARAITRLLGDDRARGVRRVVVDRFAAETVLSRELELPAGVALVQEPRGERHVPVAAASIVARAEFLDGLAACERLAGVPLHKGAGAPVDTAARRVVRAGGRELLARVAKMHFKNTGRLPPD